MSALERSKLWLAHKLAGSALGGRVVGAERTRNPIGAWTGELAFKPRRVNPYLYEALREALPIIDGAIEKLVTLDGLVTVEGGSDKLTQEIADWMATVPVNDLQAGLQSAYAGQGNELYEQGFGIIERTVKGRDIVNLRVADSKGVRFLRDQSGTLRIYYSPPGEMPDARRDGTAQLERILRGSTAFAIGNTIEALAADGYVELDPAALLCAVNMPEADNPYGTSKLRSIEVVSEIILRIENATGRVWERFGDPTFNILYQTKNKAVANDPAQLTLRATEIASRLATALSAKANGNSADFVNAIGIDDKLSVEILGAVSAVLEIEAPTRHLLEQVVAKFGIPSWMLGQHWSTAERLAETQGELALMESRTRWSTRKPSLDALIETMLRLRGRTWKPGDWQLVQTLPNLADELKKAQAEFMRGQTQMMLAGQTPGEAPASPAEPGSDARGGGGKGLTAAQITAALEEADHLDEVPALLSGFTRAPAPVLLPAPVDSPALSKAADALETLATQKTHRGFRIVRDADGSTTATPITEEA